VPRGGST